MKFLIFLFMCMFSMIDNQVFADVQTNDGDWAQLSQYKDQNELIKANGQKPHLVLMGDSITEFWTQNNEGDFVKEGLVNRGISGQTTSQMVHRFTQDVVDLKPDIVHILAGTNDIAGNSGPFDFELTKQNIQSMVQLAKANGIKVILGAVPPAEYFYWNKDVTRPITKIKKLNAWIRRYSSSEGVIFLDYFNALYDGSRGLHQQFMDGDDAVHPNATGNRVMDKLVDAALGALNGELVNIIPKPYEITKSNSADNFILTGAAKIYVEPATPEMMNLGLYLAEKLKPSTGYALQVLPVKETLGRGNIFLTTRGVDSTLGAEGYKLTATKDLISVVALQPEGVFRGLQTLRQMLPPAIDSTSIQPGPWALATGTIRDYPRFAWRGAMLDVSRHFFTVAEVKHYIDLLASYKINRFHIHLTDDQGWRIAINKWSNLSSFGGNTEVGGTPGGFYTQTDYSEIVSYAQSRYMMVIPEIDMPGHTNAALTSYSALNCNGIATKPYTGVEVGFSSLCVSSEITYEFIEDVIKEIAALTPGPYIHIGGDEAHSTTDSDYIGFLTRVQAIVQAAGKQMIGWEEISKIKLSSTSVAQHWNNSDLALRAVQQGIKVIMSPASLAYMDMKYDTATKLGQDWAGYIDEQKGYAWDPTTHILGLQESSVLGVEAPVWTETLASIADIEYMAFPRIIGYAEIGWSQKSGRSWNEYKDRLGLQGQRLNALGVNFYKSPLVNWK